MMSIIFTLVSFIVAISILVAIHEYGHYIVAKKLGVKILRFSIGFGKPLWKKQFGKDQTEFVIAALPLGGYVKMLDKREADVAADEEHREFTRQSVWTRIAIVAAGPAFNFLFAIFAYWMMFVVGVSGIKPVIGTIEQNSLADRSGLVSGYEIISVNDNKTPIWDVAVKNIIPAIVDRSQATLELKDNNGNIISRTLDFTATTGEIKVEKLFDQLGFKPWRPTIQPVVGLVVENSPAEKVGFKIGDHILKVNHTETADWVDVVEIVSSKPEEILQVVILRNGNRKTLQVIPEKIEHNGKVVGRLGLGHKTGATYPEEMRVTHGYNIFESLPRALSRTWDFSALTLKMIGKIFTGDISIKNLSGPVSIAQYAGYSASAGLARFMDFLAIVSISLGILNLLPVPILDGGHLMYYFVEVVRKKPVSEETQEFATRIGMILLFTLMVVALYNDILRVLG
ncbi:MAG: RIP metalloprotease RseP [Gammaproteobacteria bacterium]|nr:RIP metalloprotease RseP [Gammaproteobacteria bacterium]MCW8988301.1 RIP metalloprotease RseP [Gammaproteobacteria bacterium]